jgi:DNA (cytosine-5)-methyltransferase 1
MITLGSLFDGIGVFPLAAQLNGITPVWASEIEKAPIAITKYRFPQMQHLGDITKLNGGDIPAVDVISFGSPCQNLSQIGKRDGLAGEKSGLFFHAIRIIQEMREATNGEYPSIAIWENVGGVFSSNNRLDFAAVLQAFAGCPVPMPASGRWAKSGMVRGGAADIAWRLMDAQHWAIPKLARRQRVFLVADFRGQRAGEILFKPRPMQQAFEAGAESRLPTAPEHRGSFIEAGRRVPQVYPFQDCRMRGMAKHKDINRFLTSFGKPSDPFPTLLASNVNKFAFWYEDKPLAGCIRYLTETECERLMGLPEGWTKYGAGEIEIRSSARYKALGNSIALPCAGYIMAGVKEVLDG